jgi:WD domain, G-beta repeat
MPGVASKPSLFRSMTQLWRQTLDESAVSVSWSADGQWLAAASAGGSVYVFETATGHCSRQWPAHQVGAHRLAWHPHDPILASGGQDGRLCLWDPHSDTSLKAIQCGAGWVEHVAWSGSGQYLATASGRKLRLWSKQGDLLQDYADHQHTVAALAWKNGSNELVSACYGRLQFWLPESKDTTRTFEWKGSMLSLAWSPDGRYLCHGNQDATVHFWIVKSGQELQMWGYPTKVRELSWDCLSRYLATGGGPAITIWDCSGKGPANTKPTVLKYHRAPVSQLAYQRSGPILASGCSRGQLALWKPRKRATPDAVVSLPGPITEIAWSPHDGHFAAAAEDGSVAVFVHR